MLNDFLMKSEMKSFVAIFLSSIAVFLSPVSTVYGAAPTAREKTNAERGDVAAQVNLAITYYNNKDYTESAKWFTKAAEAGNAVAQYNLGNMHADGMGGLQKDYAEAVKWYQKSADQGYGFAQNNVGIAYKNGQGVAQDYVEAVKWFTKAAEQNIAVAQNTLGAIYATGVEGIPQDYTKAVQWYQKAAENNDANGQLNLGSMYTSGNGVKKDVVQAYLWISLAAAQNKKSAAERLADLQQIMTPEQITEAKNLAEAWKNKSNK